MIKLIEILAERIADYFVLRGIIFDEEKPVYKYGAEITISSVLGIILILLIGVVSGNLIESLMFLVCFVPIRVYTGGYHADTYFKCNLSFCLIFVTNLVLYKVIPEWCGFIISLSLMLFTLVVVVLFAPVKNENKQLTDSEKITYRKISIIGCLILSLIEVLMWFLGFEMYLLVSLTLFTTAIAMIVEVIKNKFIKRGRIL